MPITVFPNVHVATQQTTTKGERIENVSFRHEVASELTLLQIESGLFPFQIFFKGIAINPADPQLEINNVVWALEKGQISLRWASYSPQIKTARIYWVSNKRKNLYNQWISYQNGIILPFTVLAGERIDIFFEVYDQTSARILLEKNSYSLYIGKKDKTIDDSGFYQYNTANQAGLPTPLEVHPFVSLPSEILGLEASLYQNQLRIVWTPLALAAYSIEAYHLTVLDIQRTLITSTYLQEPDASFYQYAENQFESPYSLRIRVLLKVRRISDNAILWAQTNTNTVEVFVAKKQTEDVLINGSTSVYTTTGTDVTSLLPKRFKTGESNIVKEFFSLMYHAAKGVEVLKWKRNLVEELDTLENVPYTLISNLNDPALIRAMISLKGQPKYVDTVIKKEGVEYTLLSENPYDILLTKYPSNFNPLELADKLIDSLPITAHRIIIHNKPVECIAELDGEAPELGYGILSDCFGFRYRNRVIIFIVNTFGASVSIEVTNTGTTELKEYEIFMDDQYNILSETLRISFTDINYNLERNWVGYWDYDTWLNSTFQIDGIVSHTTLPLPA